MGSGGKQRTTTTTNQVTTQRPEAPAWISQPWQDYARDVGDLQWDPARYITPTNANLQGAFSQASQPSPYLGAIENGMDTTRGLTDFSAGDLKDVDLSPYMNPYTRDVIDASMADYGALVDDGLNRFKAATPMGSYGGSRQGVGMGQLVADAARGRAAQLAGLRQANFGQAQQGAMFDLSGRRSDAAFRGNMAQSLFNMGTGADANRRANIGMMADIGDRERQVAEDSNPNVAYMRWLQSRAGLMGAIPNSIFVGQTGTQNGTTSSTSSYSPGLLDVLGTGALIFGASKGNPLSFLSRAAPTDGAGVSLGSMATPNWWRQ